MSTKSIRPRALFLIKNEHSAVHTQTLHMLASMGVDIYANQECIEYNNDFNDHQVNVPLAGMSFDFLIYEGKAYNVGLDLLKKDGFVFESLDLVYCGPEIVQEALFIMIRERSSDYNPNEMIIIDNGILPGLSDDSRPSQRLVSAYIHQYRHALRKRARNIADLYREFKVNDNLLINAFNSVMSQPFQDYVSREDKDEIVIPWGEQDDTPPWKVDEEKMGDPPKFDADPDPEIAANPICPLGVSGIPVSE